MSRHAATNAEFSAAVRAVAARVGVDLGTITFSGPGLKDMDLRINIGPQPTFSPHQQKVLGILTNARDIYEERSAVYKDNYKAVGRVMEAMFPDGAPPLRAREDYDRWHIFELMIVKLTRYSNNYSRPHQDSLDDLLVYAAILGALDREFYEVEAQQRAEEKAQDSRKAMRENDDESRGYAEYDEDELDLDL